MKTRFRSGKTTGETIYFLFSSVFLIVRTILVFYYGGTVNESSKKILSFLREAPTSNLCEDVRFWIKKVGPLTNLSWKYSRLVDVVQSDNPKLSGANFFYLTRSLILSIAGKFQSIFYAHYSNEILWCQRQFSHTKLFWFSKLILWRE